MNKWTISLLSTLVVVLGVGWLVYPLMGQGQREPIDKATLMKKKLEHAQKVLEALTLNQLEKAGAEAQNLIQVRKEASFRAIKTPEYELFAEDFERAAEAMVKACKEKNLEAAKLHYLGMTLSCFNCHAYVRDQAKRG